MFWQKKNLLTDVILLLPCQTQERRRTKIKTAIGYLVEGTGLVFGIVTKNQSSCRNSCPQVCTMTWTTETLQTYGISIFLHFFALF